MPNPFELVTPLWAGYVGYEPWFKIGYREELLVQEFLVDHGYSDGPENFDIVCDWRFVQADKDPETGAMSNREDAFVALCHDGGDWEDGVYFFIRRREWVGDRALYIHVPEREVVSDEMIRWTSTMNLGALGLVRDYAAEVVQDWEKWHKVPDPEGEGE